MRSMVEGIGVLKQRWCGAASPLRHPAGDPPPRAGED
jgi:hypothetical protein